MQVSPTNLYEFTLYNCHPSHIVLHSQKTLSAAVTYITQHMTAEEFDQHCQDCPDFKNTPHIVFEKAVLCNNISLAKHIVEILDVHTLDEYSLLLRLVLRNPFPSLELVSLMISKGVDLNQVTRIQNEDGSSNASLLSLPCENINASLLLLACENNNACLVKLLLKNGTYLPAFLNPYFKIALLFGTVTLQHIIHDLHTPVVDAIAFSEPAEHLFKSVRQEIEDERFLFWKGRISSPSAVSTLPKEIVAHILSFEYSNPDTEYLQQYLEKRGLAISRICRKELLFLLGNQCDASSALSILPRSAAIKILSNQLVLQKEFTMSDADLEFLDTLFS